MGILTNTCKENEAGFYFGVSLFPIIFCHFFIFITCIEALGSNLPNYTEEKAMILHRVEEVEECFFNQIDRQDNAFPGLKDEMSGFTKIFISEQLSKQLMEKLLQPSKTIPLLSLPVEDFCLQYLVMPYLEKYPKAVKQRSKKSKTALAPLGHSPIESESIFVELEHNLLGKHNRGHSDITKEALEALRVEFKFSDIASEVIIRASQGPDLWKWKEEIYHAHTAWYDQDNPSDRKEKIEMGVRKFATRLANIIKILINNAEHGASDRALFLLGVGSHLVQDLIYHRGMTLQQHAGLFMTSRNPDFPKGNLEDERWEEAKELTIKLVMLVKQFLSYAAWENMKKWEPIEKFNFLNLGNDVFNNKQDIGIVALAEYVLLAKAYLDGSRDPLELNSLPACRIGLGVPCWNPNEVWESVVQQLRKNE